MSDLSESPRGEWRWGLEDEPTLYAPDGVKGADVNPGYAARILDLLNAGERAQEDRDEWEEARENYRGTIGKLTAEVAALTARLEAAEGTLSLVEPEFLSLDAFEAFAAWRALAGAETQEAGR